ncbi:MAG: hypothetical protein JSV04_15240 [Candidatus Heimdallarchaeota archaeon]|nr:MAG: hypothetical protein JSV04_15240 [Candidatus Heimdallarchaeota archaeon]
MEKLICGIIIGEHPSLEEAQRHAEKMKDCLYLAVSAVSQNRIYSIFIVPEEKKWWLKYPESDPAVTGLGQAQVFLVENVIYPETFDLKLPDQKTATAPCGENCEICQLRNEYNCKGCPATFYYKG